MKAAAGCHLFLMLLAGASVATMQGTPVVPAGPEPFTMRVVATGLDAPWELTWGPDDQLWVTERRGKRVLRINPLDGSRSELLTVADAHQSVAQDGLLGMAFHRDLNLLNQSGSGNDYVYLALTYDAAPGETLLRSVAIRRYTYDRRTRRLESPMDILTGLPAGDDHVAGRLVFGPDQKLYLSLGDEGANWLQNSCRPNRALELPTAAEVNARDWTHYQGKILRVNLDGSIPPDNPSIAGVRSHVFSYGHRNPQGLVFDAGGRLYESEHGPSSDDEVNLIEAGGNYGWPRVAGYRDDKGYAWADWSASRPQPCASLRPNNGSGLLPSVPTERETDWKADFKPPIQTFFTVDAEWNVQPKDSTVAPGSLDVVASDRAIPGWNGSLLLPSLLRGVVFRIKLAADGRSVIGTPLQYFKTTNRYRDLAVHPGQHMFYVITDVEGLSMDGAGRPTRMLANPGSVLEFRD
jgi:PQQ-dependent dehydrogenase (s-GDH family)